ncbi:Glycine--tRNA ligase 1, mitochondrial [Polyrhizophydium stewartii]|uniref:glycine--tRNA ligase n=1 Tax=Polyrhizophydium stewartii TaxID=2732419 RepID=A0ABR4NKT5_9FUNG|nr:Glycine--tRNA ligase 1, mitochondrial [Polyrhizophydium stewartii]
MADLAKLDDAALEAAVQSQGDTIKALKARKAPKEEVQPAVDHLLALKAELAKRLAGKDSDKFDRTALESLLAKRFFVTPSFSIYGGIAGLFDYGPAGCALQNNILSLWRQHFVLEEDMLEIECTNLTPESVLKTSGHVDRFTDYMVKDSKTGDIFRADHLVKQVLTQRLEDDRQLRLGLAPTDAKKSKGGKPKGDVLEPAVREHYELVLETLDNYQGDDLAKLIKDLDVRAPETNNEVTKPVLFNLMFDVQIGPTGQFKGYMRPETAQGHFLNFKKLLEFNNEQMPFASASIGKSFRNEISPRQGLLRVREFTMAEIEHYVHPERKNHPRFPEVRDIVMPLYSVQAQLAAAGPTKMSIGDAVAKGIVNNETLGYFMARIYLFLVRIGIDPERLRFRQHMANEMAHYACDCWDAEIKSSYGWIESVGCADRSAFDLTAHSRRTGEKLIARETLAEPIIRDALVLEIDKSKFGPAFKKDAKAVQGYFEGLMRGSADEWDEEKLAEIDAKLKADQQITVVGTDGNEYVVKADMLKIKRKTIKISVREYTPNVIEPSFGIGRILYALLEHSYFVRKGDEQRAVFKFPAAVAPFKALVAPISNSGDFAPSIRQVVAGLRQNGISNKVDDSGTSIGRRYARNDELGTPFAVTIDFQTVKDGTVTLRERDTTKQIREAIPVIVGVVRDLVEERTTWDEVIAKYPVFVAQDLE